MGKKLTTESLLAKSPSGVFRFWEGEAGRAALFERYVRSTVKKMTARAMDGPEWASFFE
jgi:hypothetical protein